MLYVDDQPMVDDAGDFVGEFVRYIPPSTSRSALPRHLSSKNGKSVGRKKISPTTRTRGTRCKDVVDEMPSSPDRCFDPADRVVPRVIARRRVEPKRRKQNASADEEGGLLSRHRRPAVAPADKGASSDDAPTLDALRSRALDVVLPETLDDSYEFARFVECAAASVQYVDAVFALAIEGDDESDLFDAESRRLDDFADDMRCISKAFTSYWMERADDMLKEVDLSMDDACVERLPTATIAFNVVALADVTFRVLSRSRADAADFDEETTPTSETTAESFVAARKQLLVQSAKPILKYGAGDLVKAIDSLCRSWHRVSVDAGLMRYVRALRLRYGMLIRCAAKASTLSPSDSVWYDAPVETPDGAYRIPKVSFMEEMTHRFRAFAEVEWMWALHGPAWTRDEIRDRLDSVARRGNVVVTTTLSVPPASDAGDGRGGPSSSSVAEDEEDDDHHPRDRRSATTVRATRRLSPTNRDGDSENNAPFDHARGATEILKLLGDYAEAVSGGGAIYSAFRNCYLEYLICPGDDGVFRARNPNMTPSTNNILINMRGSKLFSEATHVTLVEPQDMLRGESHASSINSRALYPLQQEVVGLCAFDSLMKGRFNVSWLERYTVTRATYRIAKDKGYLSETSMPVLMVTSNKYDVLYRGRILETGSVFESIAWWLEIMRSETGGVLPILAAATEAGSIDPTVEAADATGDVRETFELVSDETSTGRRRRLSESGADDDEEDERDELELTLDGDDDDYDYADADRREESNRRRSDPMEELERKTRCVDASSICEVPRRGAASFRVKTDRKRRCTISDVATMYSKFISSLPSSSTDEEDEAATVPLLPPPAKRRRIVLQY